MFITLTNASPVYKDEPIVINADHIISMWRGIAVRGVNEETGEVTEKEEVTFIFVPPHGTWEVKDSVADIEARLK